jgi:hypothetical protein
MNAALDAGEDLGLGDFTRCLLEYEVRRGVGSGPRDEEKTYAPARNLILFVQPISKLRIKTLISNNNIMYTNIKTPPLSLVENKAIPVQVSTSCPEGSKNLRLLDFKTIGE